MTGLNRFRCDNTAIIQSSQTVQKITLYFNSHTTVGDNFRGRAETN